MISFPNAKINLGLNITEKRPDEYHNLASCFYPIGWTDILEIIPSKSLTFSATGITIPGNKENNICLKAYQLLKNAYDIPAVDIHLHKVIPIGAGLGGGSSDGAFTLKMLNDIFNLSLSVRQLALYASHLGSDCPFFIESQPKYVTGTGNIFNDINTDAIAGKKLVVVKPNIHLSTAKAYTLVQPHAPSYNIREIIENQSISDWKSMLTNDFEAVIFPKYAKIAEIKELLYEKGALYASMTGSGAAVIGIFEEDAAINIAATEAIVWVGDL